MVLVNEPSSRQVVGNKCEVFLSFMRGEDKDSQESFPSLLYSSLREAGISVFKDDISNELLQSVIEGCEISIIIFSQHYASSRRCLEELTKIMEFRRACGHVVLPILYGVEPFEVRNQTFSFGEAFRDFIKKVSPTEDEVSRWRTALNEAADISGFIVSTFESRDENDTVKAVVENVCDILDKKKLIVAEYPVGVDGRVQEVISILQNHQYEDVVMVGIWGMGGIGKTTIAKAIYNQIGDTFEVRSYLSEIRKVWHQKEGPVCLQKQLLSEIYKTTKKKINSIESGKSLLRDRLSHKKALVVLDDVDKLSQLNALVGHRDWFKPGSIIIITTRNKHILLQIDCCVYTMENLNEWESMKLLSWYAFKQESHKEDFDELSRDIVAYSGGLPLALEVLGTYLFDREVKQWKSALEKLKKIPNDMIYKKLKISYDSLDDLEKEIYLDISCFFIGMDKDEVIQILNGCELFADIGIKTLMDRSLVTIDENKTLGMHDLLRDMGREIVRQQSPGEPGKRSRLWFHEDALDVLSKHMGTKATEGLSLELSQDEEIAFSTKAFKKMKRLRLLRLDNAQLSGDCKYFSRELRWLCWHGFPLKYIPGNFYQKKLVAIDLKYSNLRQVWKEPPLLRSLKILNLSHSRYLVQTPDFSNLPNLETLILKDCPSLSNIHPSIGLLHKLLLLDLEDCIGLHTFPRSICNLKCLKTFIVPDCMNIEKLKDDTEHMKSLTTLVAPRIKKVPSSIVELTGYIGYQRLSRDVIPSLYQSWISPTNNPLLHIPTHGGVPSSILWDMLNSTRDSTPKQQSLLLQEGSEIHDSSLCVKNCMEILRFENSLGHLLIHIGKNSEVFHTLSNRVSQGLNLPTYSDYSILPGDNYPYWLAFEGEGASVKFKVPAVNGRNHIKGMTICSVYIPLGDSDNKACESCIICLMIVNYTKATTLIYMEDKLNSLEEEAERKEIISNLESDNDQVEVKPVFGNGFTVKKTAVYLIYKESFDEQMEPLTSKVTNLSGTKHIFEEEEEEEEGHQSIRPRKAMKI